MPCIAPGASFYAPPEARLAPTQIIVEFRHCNNPDGAYMRAIDSAGVSAFAGVRYSTLRTWKQDGLWQPSVLDAATHGTPVLWSVRDAVALRFLQRIRQASGRRLSDVASAVDECLPMDFEAIGVDATLGWNGSVLQYEDGDEVREALRSRRQEYIASFFNVHERIRIHVDEAWRLGTDVDVEAVLADPSLLRRRPRGR